MAHRLATKRATTNRHLLRWQVIAWTTPRPVPIGDGITKPLSWKIRKH